MPTKHRRERSGLTHLDPERLERLRLRSGMSKTLLADRAGVKRSTVQRVLRGDGVFLTTAVQVARALGIEDVSSLLVSSGVDTAVTEPIRDSQIGEWAVDEFLGPWVTTSNGLQFRVCRMQHLYVAGRLGRGKRYDLLHLAARDREELREHLVRHSTVSERIGTHPHVSENLNTLPVANEESWWVIDRWAGHRTLSDVLSAGPYPRPALPRLMMQIALGLGALHAADVVFRELAPSRVVISEKTEQAILTDFELAKLLDSQPTVSTDWPDDPYRAPEVETGCARRQSDLYSWGRVLVHALTGQIPPETGDVDIINRAGLPKSVWRMATDCLATAPSDRPSGVQDLLRAMRRWK